MLFINAVNEVTRERSQSLLKPDHLARIVNAYRAFANQEGFCQVATRDDIRANHANLNIPLYVRTNGNGNVACRETLAKAITEWRGSSCQLKLSLDRLVSRLKQKGD